METIRKLGMLAFASRLKRLSERLMQDVRLVYRREGLDFEPRWFLVFYQLIEASPMSITAIAEAVGITHPAVNQIAAEMEKAGLIASSPDPRDRRKRCLALTPLGKKVARAIRPLWADIESATREVVESTGVDLLRAVETIESALETKGVCPRVLDRMERRRNESVRILDFETKYRSHFKTLNYQWLREFFRIEERDRQVLEDPENRILAPGGRIFFAQSGRRIVGTCALIRVDPRTFELAKMAVTREYRRRRIGQRLAEHAIDTARSLGASSLILYTSPKLEAAVALYRKLGFQPVPVPDKSIYRRSTIMMTLKLDDACDR